MSLKEKVRLFVSYFSTEMCSVLKVSESLAQITLIRHLIQQHPVLLIKHYKVSSFRGTMPPRPQPPTHQLSPMTKCTALLPWPVRPIGVYLCELKGCCWARFIVFFCACCIGILVCTTLIFMSVSGAFVCAFSLGYSVFHGIPGYV